MNKQRIINIVRLFAGLVAATAIIVQLQHSMATGRDLGNFFSFFTIESNIAAALLYIGAGIYGVVNPNARPLSTLRGAITLYMTLTGIVYMLLLSGNEIALQTTIGWVNIILHYIFPAIILLDWLVFPPKEYLQAKRVVLWFIFPTLYLVYSLIRGAMTGWYPYPFINPVTNGWPTVVVMIIFITFITAVIATALSLRTRQYRPKVSM